jgi:hypothetical protein
MLPRALWLPHILVIYNSTEFLRVSNPKTCCNQ